MRALSATTLRGLWAAVPTAWDAQNRLDAGVLERNCQRLAEARVDGIYTTDSDGEFYAIELDEFAELARAFGRAMESCRVDAAMGVTWCNTRGAIDRIRAACDGGIPNVHVAFPFFVPLARSDVDRFFDDLATAVPQARWIHYAHPRCGPALTGSDYDRLQRRFPQQFIGTKLSPADGAALSETLMRSPQLSHFVVDTILLQGAMLGARGCYSYWVNTLPRWHRRYMDVCQSGEWDAARAAHVKLMQWELTHIAPLRQAGHLHAIIGRARAALSGFLEDSGGTRAPYYPIAPEMQEQLQRAFNDYWADELAAEALPQALF
jgi:dihydrodipicolinate synthase/N-acetylneuraminate lyase